MAFDDIVLRHCAAVGLSARPGSSVLHVADAADHGDEWLVEELRATSPHLSITSVALEPAAEVPLASLARSAGYDVVIDQTTTPGRWKRVKDLVALVRVGGCVIARREPGHHDGARAFVGRLTTPNPVRSTLADVVASVDLDDQHLRITLARQLAPKVFEHEVDELFSARGHEDRVTRVVPAQAWSSIGVLHGNDEPRAASLRRSFEGFELTLRDYHDAWCLPQSAVLADGVALPESFRRSFSGVFSNAHLTSCTPRAVVLPDPPRRRLEGTYLHLDNEWRGQFGHNLLEQASKTWAWDRVVERHPDARAIVTRRGHTPVADWEYALLRAAGIPQDRVTVADTPVTVEHLVTATAGYYLPDRVHPHVASVYARIADSLLTSAEPGERPDRVFFSRKPGARRACLNAERVEQIFMNEGFRVVYPEDHPLATQVAMVRGAGVFAGYAGSGMYHLALTAGAPQTVIAITAATYNEVAESAFASLYGHELYMIWCADVEPHHKSSPQSDFRFSSQDEAYLRRVLATVSGGRGGIVGAVGH